MELLYSFYEKIKYFFVMSAYANLAAEFPEFFDDLMEEGHNINI